MYDIACAEPLDDEFANPFLSVETPIAEQIEVVNDNAGPEPRSDSRWIVDNVDVSSIFHTFKRRSWSQGRENFRLYLETNVEEILRVSLRPWLSTYVN